MKRGRSKSAPKYRLHKRSGQVVVSINGKDIYLGKHSTEESQQRYRAAIADHWASPTEAPKVSIQKPNGATTITQLAVEFAKYTKRKHGENGSEWYQIRLVLKSIRET